MRSNTPLRRLAITVWFAWIGLLALSGVLLACRIWRPLILLMAPLPMTMIIAALALVAGALHRLVRGVERSRTLAWLLIGTAPLFFAGGQGMYALGAMAGREDRFDLPLKILAPLGGSLMDFEAMIRYPQHTVGGQVIMIAPSLANARAQVVAMDRHILSLERRLGEGKTWRVTWVRGPLFGLHQKACFDIAFGSRPGEVADDQGGLSTLDRHEVAHCVITSFRSPWSEPPALLVEGWAEANSGIDPAELALRAWKFRDEGQDLTLAELCGPQWYGRHKRPVYVQGGPLVNFLLRRFGPERFLQLYTTSGRTTVAADFQRILGMSLDGLDSAYWAEIERLVPPEDRSPEGRLARLQLGPGVDPAEWKAFVAAYFAAVKRLKKSYEHVRMKFDWNAETRTGGQTSSKALRVHLVRSGAYWSLRLDSRGGFGQVSLAHPTRSFEATREGPEGAWEVEDTPELEANRRYRRILRKIEDYWFSDLTVPSLMSPIVNRGELSGILVEELGRFSEEGQRYVSARLKDPTPNESGLERRLTFVLSADDPFSVRSLQIADENGSTQDTLEYDVRDGIPVVTSHHNRGILHDGTQKSLRLTVVEQRFEATPESEFSAAQLLTGRTVHKVVSGSSRYAPSATIADWYWVPLVLGAVSLAGGAAISFLYPGPGRPPREPAPGDGVTEGMGAECASPPP